MWHYFINRLVACVFVLWTIFAISAGGFGFYEKKYENVKITKQEKERNACHHTSVKVYFECVGVRDGKKYDFKEEYHNIDGDDEYKKLVNEKTYYTYTWYGILTIVTEIFLFFGLLFAIGDELERYYDKEDRRRITNVFYTIWKKFFIFSGYSKDITEKVFNEMDLYIEETAKISGDYSYNCLHREILDFQRLNKQSKVILKELT